MLEAQRPYAVLQMVWSASDPRRHRAGLLHLPPTHAFDVGVRDAGAECRTYYLVLPFWALLIVLAAYPAVVIRRAAGAVTVHLLQRRESRRAGVCRRCGYHLDGNPTGVCSECGLPRSYRRWV